VSIVADPDAGRLRRTLEDLAEIGPGWSGTAGEERRREYVADRLREAGYSPELEAFSYLAGDPAATARCTSSVLDELPARPVQYTAAKAVEGPLIPVGQGRPEDLAALDGAGVALTGSVCLARTAMPFAITAELARRGAVGLIVHADTADDVIPEYAGRGFPPPLAAPWDRAHAPIPGLTVSRSAGDRLLAAHGSGRGAVAIAHETTYREAESANVVATTGSGAGPTLVLVAHYDTQLAGGVWDNGTGVAALLELARLCREKDVEGCEIRLIAVGCEEQLMWGSQHYVHAHAEELADDCVGMINWDSPSAAYPVKNTCWCSETARATCAEAARRAQWPVDVWVEEDFPLSDTAPFARLGIPTMWFWQYPPMHPYYHSDGDTLELVDADKLGGVVRVGVQAVRLLAGGA